MKNLLKAGIKILIISILTISCTKAKKSTHEIIIIQRKGGIMGINQRMKVYSDAYILFEDLKNQHIKINKMRKEDFNNIKEIISKINIRNIKEEIVPDDIYYFIDIKSKGTYVFGKLSLKNKKEYGDVKNLIEIVESYIK
jgi:hypothetical protein